MTRKLMLSVAVSALMVTGAFAQSTPPKTPTSPAATQSAPAEKTPAPDTTGTKASTNGAAGQPQVVTEQTPDQLLASKFKGTDVMGSNGKKIGEIGDILFDKDGKILAYVVSTGGFLGIGAKEVAMPPSAFQVIPGQNGGSAKLKISMNEQQLKAAQKFTEYQPPKPVTTGAGGAASPMGGGAMGGGAHPPGGAR